MLRACAPAKNPCRMYGAVPTLQRKGCDVPNMPSCRGDDVWIRKDADTRVLHHWQVALGQGLYYHTRAGVTTNNANKCTGVIFMEAGQIKDITKAFHGRRKVGEEAGWFGRLLTSMVFQNKEYNENSPLMWWDHKRRPPTEPTTS
jgi:hypothetical protein